MSIIQEQSEAAVAKCNDKVVYDNHDGEYKGSNVDFEEQ